ncbi:Rap guanine nucleotide exchange factor [Orchesella cincta]|uniref:Rap guanine nucleotide exchange factor n=1 Tax=Orchesella cincta TaxID=48709 RepID=A0A1D2MLX3_ORCCI|nr:Rap guanine nucleotide exchange factor [Orchesella cincta]
MDGAEKMMLVDMAFLKSLKRDPERRTDADIQTIYYTLRSLQCLSRLSPEAIYQIAQTGYYWKKQANDILYCRGEIAHCWFVLISGSVFIDGSMFLPITSFGRRASPALTRRPNECLILEPSEMIAIDYIDYYETGVQQTQHRASVSSNSSSAYSGSDTIGSSDHSSKNQNAQIMSSSDNIDLSGLIESTVDSDTDDDVEDDEDDEEEDDLISPYMVRDCVRECLEKDPSERTEHDISVLMEFTQHLQAFNDLTMTVRRALCASMVFAVVEKSNTIVLSDGEELDSWSVLVHGSVEVVLPSGETQVLSAGDSFGLPPTLDKQYFRGLMRTRVDDCQFVCVTQEDYFRILKQGLDNQTTVYDPATNRPVLITEAKLIDSHAAASHTAIFKQQNVLLQPTGQLVIRGTIDQLLNQLVSQETPSVDPTFVEDFLLTQRIFMKPVDLISKLIEWFHDTSIRDRVTRVVLLWVNNHFVDFEFDKELMAMLQRFHSLLEQTKELMSGQLRLLQIACSAKSRTRTITLTRASREDPLPFNIMGGADNGYGVFVSSTEERADTLGMRVGDELIQINSITIRGNTLSKTFELLRGSTHLVLIVKSNFLGHYECINSTTPLLPVQIGENYTESEKNQHHRFLLQHNQNTKTKHRIKKAIWRMIKGETNPDNPDETTTIHTQEYAKIDFPENVLKIYRPDQSFKYLLVNKETTAREVVLLALREFNEPAPVERSYALFQVSCVQPTEKQFMLKQTRLPDHLDCLAERIPLGARYYVKRSDSTDPLIQNEMLPELYKESEVTLLQLNPVELALQLTLEDYAAFRQIEMTEFIDELFTLNSQFGTPNLKLFAELVNRETFWVVSEILNERTSAQRRGQVIKRFIKVATQCRDCRNFNSMFAIISGLGHTAVSRLKSTWDKMSNKHRRLFQEMQDLMDPSRNMGRYRSLIAQSQGQTPMIPFYPVVKKDLTFIDLGNSTHIDGLINFEKMRMVSKEIRSLTQMSAAPFDTSTQPTMAAMNQLTVSSNSSFNNNPLTTTTGKGGRRKDNSKTESRKSKSGSKGGSAGGGGSTGGSGQVVVKKSSGAPNPKKMYEEMNMIRKVKAYLHRLKIISDESVLYDMSIAIEPAPNQSSNSGSTNQLNKPSNQHQHSFRRQPSPTLSTSSSASSESTNRINNNNRKFGTGSPGSYQKLLSLSEPGKTKIKGSSVEKLTGIVSPASLRKLSVPVSLTTPTIHSSPSTGSFGSTSTHHHSTSSADIRGISGSLSDSSSSLSSNNNSSSHHHLHASSHVPQHHHHHHLHLHNSNTRLILNTESSSVLPASNNKKNEQHNVSAV